MNEWSDRSWFDSSPEVLFSQVQPPTEEQYARVVDMFVRSGASDLLGAIELDVTELAGS